MYLKNIFRSDLIYLRLIEQKLPVLYKTMLVYLMRMEIYPCFYEEQAILWMVIIENKFDRNHWYTYDLYFI